jgi:hypothetical protein
MAEIIDVLRPDIGGGGLFTVDNTVLSVPMFAPLVFNKMYATTGNGLFQRGDNIIILSAGYIMPESFVMANQSGKPAAAISLVAQKNISGANILVEPFGNAGQIAIPFANYEMSIGVFIDTERLLIDDDFYMCSVFPGGSLTVEPEISMINVPASLNGITMEAFPFIKVLHNIPLT